MCVCGGGGCYLQLITHQRWFECPGQGNTHVMPTLCQNGHCPVICRTSQCSHQYTEQLCEPHSCSWPCSSHDMVRSRYWIYSLKMLWFKMNVSFTWLVSVKLPEDSKLTPRNHESWRTRSLRVYINVKRIDLMFLSHLNEMNNLWILRDDIAIDVVYVDCCHDATTLYRNSKPWCGGVKTIRIDCYVTTVNYIILKN